MFVKKLLSALADKPPVVVGIDPDSRRISLYPHWVKEILGEKSSPSDMAVLYREYGFAIIDAVHDLVPAVKPQIAFFEEWGHHGIEAFESVIAYARDRGLLVIADAKRGDVPSTSERYAATYMEGGEDHPLSADAVTVNPYLGMDSLAPFLARSRPPFSTGVFVLLKTSNPGSSDIQDLPVAGKGVEEKKLYEHLAELLHREIGDREGYSNIGAVVGATHPEAGQRIRRILPHSFLLVPGLGAQGGDVGRMGDFLNPDGRGALFNFSRSIIYPDPLPHRGDQGKLLRENIRAAALSCIREVKSHLP